MIRPGSVAVPGADTNRLVGSWRLGPSPALMVPSAPGLNLKPQFAIETRFRPSDLTEGRNIVCKDKEYALRIDWPGEGSRISFYVYSQGQWEPRVSAFCPATNEWYHVVAAWDGYRSFLWVDGEPFTAGREVPTPAATANPVLIGARAPLGGPFAGEIEYVRVYGRMLTTPEIIGHAYGIEAGAGTPGDALGEFDFAKGLHGWSGQGTALVASETNGLRATGHTSRSYVLRRGLDLPTRGRDFLALRLAVDRGTRADLIFVTTMGAGRMRFPTIADGRPHTYVLEPWTWAGWGGRLLTLGVVPSEATTWRASLASLWLSDEINAEPELSVTDLFPGASLPRAGRTETVVARLGNAGGPAAKVEAKLTAPPGVEIEQGSAREAGPLGFHETREVSWSVRVPTPGLFPLRIALSAGAGETVAKEAAMRFQPSVEPPPVAYVPEPVPPPGRYTLWTHYCPLWKTGTHGAGGWEAIEPWPQRTPVLGWYNEGDPEVADWHIKYWLEHGITGVIYCWYRSNLNAPVTQHLGHAIHDGLLHARYLPRIRFGIMWENGCGQGVGSTQDLLDHLLPFWIENYFSHPSYLRVDGKPVLYVWVPQNVTRHLGSSDEVRRAFDLMRERCRAQGLGGLYIVGCVGGADRPALATMAKEGWDASSAYNTGWRQPPEVKTVGDFVSAPVEGFIEQQEQVWKAKRGYGLLPDIPAAMMGWDSRPWKETPFFWSENTPEKFRDLCQRAKAVLDSGGGVGPATNTLVFCCWNEFGEGHYIEPTRGYGFDYLDVIRDVFTSGHKPHVDFGPEDLGRPCDSWYRAARKSAGPPAGSEAAWSGPRLSAWQPMMGLGEMRVEAGVLRAVSTSSDPAWHLPATRLRASRYARVVVDLRVSRPGVAQLFWTTPSAPGASEAASVTAPVLADGQFNACEFAVARNAHWTGCIQSLRFDPTAESGVKVEIRSIRLE